MTRSRKKVRRPKRPPLNKAHGARLRELRLSRGLSLQAVSDKTGIRKPGISMMELGKQEITLSHLEKLLAALDYTWDDFGLERPGSLAENDEAHADFKAAG